MRRTGEAYMITMVTGSPTVIACAMAGGVGRSQVGDLTKRCSRYCGKKTFYRIPHHFATIEHASKRFR
jgi:hypothetical protein